LQQYKAATQSRPNLLGFVFVETDRKSGLEETEWQDALDEVNFLVRIANDSPRDGEGHGPGDARLVLGIIPWAPVPAGEKTLAEYVRQVRERCGDRWDLVKGVRYLVQDKPAGVMLQPGFVEGLRWLGKDGLTFDLGVDARSGGMHQLREACELMECVYKDDPADDYKNKREGVELKIIINHLCKPNLRLGVSAEAVTGHADFIQWRECIEKMASHQSTYMKLSGMFSELPPQDEGCPADITTLVEQTKPWVDVVFRAFGPARIMFGSDWPVCNVGGPGAQASWRHWHALVAAILDSQGLNAEDKTQVWSGTAIQAYNIQKP
jgi:L-rhamnono-1,4-lactonase